MKQCPKCRTTYTDESLKFCLADGTLLERTDEMETAVRQGVRVDIEPPRTVAVPEVSQPEKSGSPLLKIVIAVLVLGAIGLLVAGGAAVVYFVGTSNAGSTAKASPTPRPTATASPTVDPEKERLQKELANLQKKLEDEKKVNANRPPAFPDTNDGRPTARVNSPNDGFLALRDEPDAESGTRLAKIPHGAVVYLENCEKEQTTIAGRTGRWCMVTYDDETGWVFDAWLIYEQ